MKLKSMTVWLLYILLFATACSEDVLSDHSPEKVVPTDIYVGDTRSVLLENGFSGFSERPITLFLRAADGQLIHRSGHCRMRGEDGAHLELDYGLADGDYELLYCEYIPLKHEAVEGLYRLHLGIGCRVTIDGARVDVKDAWNSQFRMYGMGTAEHPFRISSEDLLSILSVKVASARFDEDWESLHFLQTADLDGRILSRVSREYGWIPIGFQNTSPFRSHYDGGGHKITNLEIRKALVSGVGLFGYAYNASISNVHLEAASILGDFAVGGILGATISGGGRMKTTVLQNCKVSDSTIESRFEGYGVGGLVGCVDNLTALHIHECKSTKNTIYATMNAGGIVGASARGSSILAGLCENTSSVRSDYGGAGGIVGACDTLTVASCINHGDIAGAVLYNKGDEQNGLSGVGAGGIAGGTGMSLFSGCENHGTVVGYEGVGGIVGSTRFTGTMEGDEHLCQNSFLLTCLNSGSIGGRRIVGGLCGEAQLGVEGCFNQGAVTAQEGLAGGVIGFAPLLIAQNNINSALVTAPRMVAGIAGAAMSGSFAISQNYGQISATQGHVAGIVGYAGRDMTMTYCANFGFISCTGDDPVAGLVAEVGAWQDSQGLIPDWVKYTIASLEIAAGVVGVAGIPLAIVEIPAGALNTAAGVFSAASFIASNIFYMYDGLCLIFGNESIMDIQELEQMAEDTCEILEKQLNEQQQKMQSIRGGFIPSSFTFSDNMLSYEYPANVQRLVDFCASEQNNETFNLEVQQERCEQLEKDIAYEENKMRDHFIVSGVSMILSTVAIAASGIALCVGTGGTAIPAIVAASAGFCAGVMGGVNTIVQTATTTEINLDLFNENVNGNSVNAPMSNTRVGGLVGVLHDHCVIRDCVNAGSGPGVGGHLVGENHSVTVIERSLSVAPADSWATMAGCEGHDYTMQSLYYCNEAASSRFDGSHATGLSKDDMKNPAKFSGWDIGNENNQWTIPSRVETPFPILNVSRFTK